MLGTRFEEYHLGTGLPFRLSTDIERTAECCSDAANWHNALEIQLCTAGSGYVLLDGEQYAIAPGDMAVANSCAIHYTGTDTRVAYVCLIIDARFCREIGMDVDMLEFEGHIKDPDVESDLEALIRVYGNTADICREARLRILLLKLLIGLRENHCEVRGTREGRSSFEEVRRCMNYIFMNYERKLSLEELARQAMVDKYKLCREFRRATGQTVVEYINNFRCRQVAEMLTKGQSISEAALACGFSNLSYFTKVFKKSTGQLPSEYKRAPRNKKQNGHCRQ